MIFRIWRRRSARVLLGMALLVASVTPLSAQVGVQRIDLPVGRSHPMLVPAPIMRVSVATPDVADVVVVSQRELVINARETGETDVIIWQEDGARDHYRVHVQSPSDRMQIALQIKFAEVRRDALREIGVSGHYTRSGTRVGTGIFRTDNAFNEDGSISVPASVGFLTILSDLNTQGLLAFLDAQEQRGNARILAEPSLLAGNREPATFLAGGELPIPVAQGGSAGDEGVRVTVQYREFGVRLRFVGEILSDDLIKLTVTPEVSSLDFGNAVILSGFRIPAFRTRRVETTIDVRRDQSLVISGLFNNEDERVRTGIPLIMNIPILGQLFSSTRFQRNQTELLVVVTPVIVNPRQPRASDVLRFPSDTTLPAGRAFEIRDQRPGRAPGAGTPHTPTPRPTPAPVPGGQQPPTPPWE